VGEAKDSRTSETKSRRASICYQRNQGTPTAALSRHHERCRQLARLRPLGRSTGAARAAAPASHLDPTPVRLTRRMVKAQEDLAEALLWSVNLSHWVEVLKVEGVLLPDRLLALPGMVDLLEPEKFDPSLPIYKAHVPRQTLIRLIPFDLTLLKDQ
jgi:hypothetical protein